MIMRWISDVPSKIVKIVDLGAVCAVQRHADPVVSARIQHARSEMNNGSVRPVHVLRREYIGGIFLALTCHYPVAQHTRPRCQRRADGPHPGRAAREFGKPWMAAVPPTRRRHGPDGP